MELKEFLQTQTPQESEGRPLTCLPSPFDPRDYKYPRMLTAIGMMPDNGGPIDYRPNLPTVFDQGQRGSCVACATTWTPKAFAEINEGAFPAKGLSAAYLYTRCKGLDGIPNDEGTYIRVAMQVLKNYGICPEAVMPYTSLTSLPAPRVPSIPAIAEAQAGQFKISAYAQLAGTADIDRSGLLTTIRQALLREGPITIALLVCDNFIPDANGVVPTPRGYIKGGHAVGIAGHIPGKGLIMRNSWGPDWGLNGYAYLPDEWLTAAVDVGAGDMFYVFESWTQTDIVTPKRGKQITIRPGAYSMVVDGVEVALDQPAMITESGRTMLPVRALAGAGGYLVSWVNGEVVLTDPS